MKETVEIIGYKWCLWDGPINDWTDYHLIQTISGDWLVYCQVEKFSNEKGGGIRTAPVSQDDTETIN